MRGLCAADPTPKKPLDADELRRTIRAGLSSLPHVVGTCAMGSSPDNEAMVDRLGCVHGTERLSVIDVSIIPVPPSEYVHLPTIMIAERLSEEIAKLV
jgi:choline dehydrogenase